MTLQVVVKLPHLIHEYNIHMGGVDRMDENIELYRVGVGGKKWWWKCFTYLLDTAVQNAWQLHREMEANEGVEEGTRMSQLDFRRYIVQSYLRVYAEPPSKRGPKVHKALPSRVPDSVRYGEGKHLIEEALGHPICAECGGRAREKCATCDVGLHLKCFKKFHTRGLYPSLT